MSNVSEGGENRNIKLTRSVRVNRPSTSHKIYGQNVNLYAADIYQNLHTISGDPGSNLF
jgi:hypothetical protein